MLALNDPAWSKLTTAYGTGEEAAELLLRLQPDAADSELRQELIELLLHQNTIYTATLAAMPYLANMAEYTQGQKALVDLYIMCGLMHASREGADGEDVEHSREFGRDRQQKLEDDAVRRIADGYRDGIARLSALHERAARPISDAALAGSDEDPESVYLLAAQTMYAGRSHVGRLLFEFPEGDEYAGACPFCAADWYVWPSEAADTKPGAKTVYVNEPVTHGTENQPSAEVRPCKPDDLRPELRALEQEALRLGANRLAAAIPSLDGRASCPACGQEASVWDVLTAWRGE
ncbi:hypothetical protein [Saccharibacillus sacchari]|uniref:Uncharacterized protein n=1 Tax=Saccharibacillus sacchari TaxID=456493 RepID=A0ACC6P9E0_9BACL